MLKYCLRENLLTPDENDYMAQTADVRSFSLDEIIDLMMQKGSTLTKADTNPYITEVSDIVSAKVNEVLTAGGIVQLVGSRLKFDPKDIEQGVFAVSGTKVVRCAAVVENKPARLMAIIPADLAAGSYYIEVRTKIDMGGKKLKTLKTGRCNKALNRSA